MSSASIRQLYDTPAVAQAVREIDAAQIATELAIPSLGRAAREFVNPLRLAANAATVDALNGYSLDQLLRGAAQVDEATAVTAFISWDAYLVSIADTGRKPELDELAYLASMGLLARRPHEVRNILRRPLVREWLATIRRSLPETDWIEQVRGRISASLLHVVRQQNHEDVRSAELELQELATKQRQFEANWLSQRDSQQRDALTLLGLYHLGEAIIKLAEFLLAGSVIVNGRVVADFSAELRRLLVKAEEFLLISADAEMLLWFRAVGLTLIQLRESSIWVQGRGISERIDRLVAELADVGRQTPVFSLLPSQQDALRGSLLDPTRIAIILQMPTSAGKTLLAEFAIAQTFDAYRDRTRVVYLTPTRALATQVRRTLVQDLGPLGISVSAAGSAFEEDPYELHLLQESDGVVVATPEKLDLLLRTHIDWFKDLRLVVVDEAHLIKDGERGARLELLLANIRREQPNARLLLLSPFIDNAQQIARWLSKERGASVPVVWRPSRIVLGMATVSGRGRSRRLRVEWTDPINQKRTPAPIEVETKISSADWQTNLNRILLLAEIFEKLGTTLALFSASPADAEEAAGRLASERAPLPDDRLTPGLRLAIGLARHEYGPGSRLADCLTRGVAFHHSSLSPTMRYLIEDQVRIGRVRFVAATSTLAQGMNFPVSTVLVHSVHKPYGGGNFSSAEFWNIAGRAGRVGIMEKGLVVFADRKHQNHVDRYTEVLSESVTSAMLQLLQHLSPNLPLKAQYRQHHALRPFIQFLAHAAATSSAATALANLEELLQQSLVYQQVRNDAESAKLRAVARSYLQQLTSPTGFLRVADSSGLASFSFQELYAKVADDSILRSGPAEVMAAGHDGLVHLIDALKWLPELGLALGQGEGDMNSQSVASVVQGWIEGQQAHQLAHLFPGDDEPTRVRNAGRYLYGTVSQTISWGVHAYIKGWTLLQNAAPTIDAAMLPALIQYGVPSAEGAVAALVGVPREFAESFGVQYRERHGPLVPERSAEFKDFIESADLAQWTAVIAQGRVDVDPADARTVFREMQGLR